MSAARRWRRYTGPRFPIYPKNPIRWRPSQEESVRETLALLIGKPNREKRKGDLKPVGSIFPPSTPTGGEGAPA
jgi:hypothetical protein